MIIVRGRQNFLNSIIIAPTLMLMISTCCTSDVNGMDRETYSDFTLPQLDEELSNIDAAYKNIVELVKRTDEFTPQMLKESTSQEQQSTKDDLRTHVKSIELQAFEKECDEIYSEYPEGTLQWLWRFFRQIDVATLNRTSWLK